MEEGTAPRSPPRPEHHQEASEARPVSVDSQQSVSSQMFLAETRERGLAALREATRYLKAAPAEAAAATPAAVPDADDALQQLRSADEAERAYAAFSADLTGPGAVDAFAALLGTERAEEVLTAALANLSQAAVISKPLVRAARKLLRHPGAQVRADAARFLGGCAAMVDAKAREGLTQLARLDPDATVQREAGWALQRLDQVEDGPDDAADEVAPEAPAAPADLDDADEILRRSDELIARLMCEEPQKKGTKKGPKPSPVRRRGRPRARRRVLEVSEDDASTRRPARKGLGLPELGETPYRGKVLPRGASA